MPREPLAMSIDFTRCAGHGGCIDLLPELLTADPWGYPASAAGPLRSGVPLPPETIRPAREAARLCPRAAVLLDAGR